MRYRQKLSFCFWGVLGSQFLYGVALCQEDLRIPGADHIRSVQVILTKPGLRTQVPMTEVELKKVGCSFTYAFDKERGEALSSILKSNLKIAEHRDVGFDLRNAIYLHKFDGSTYKVLLGGFDAGVEYVDGRIRFGGDGSESSVLANQSLFAKLKEWGNSTRSSPLRSAQCDD